MRLLNLIILLISLSTGPSQFSISYEDRLDSILIQLEPYEFRNLAGSMYMEHNWTLQEINDAALMAQTEAYGLGEDGMLSVLATAYGRYTSPIWCSKSFCSKTISEEIDRPLQFDGPYFADKKYGKDKYDIIKPESYLAVYKFILGFRGSCSGYNGGGYEYFNSIPGRTGECVIINNGQYIIFFSTEKYLKAQKEGIYRNIRETSERDSKYNNVCYQPTEFGINYCTY